MSCSCSMPELGVSLEQLDLMKKYRLGKIIVYDSARRQRQNELARAHLEVAAQTKIPFCALREQWPGFFRTILYLSAP